MNVVKKECPLCGKIFEAFGKSVQRKYCSPECQAEGRRRTSRDFKKRNGVVLMDEVTNGTPCKFNDGVICWVRESDKPNRDCNKCGFNPEIAEKRIEKMRFGR